VEVNDAAHDSVVLCTKFEFCTVTLDACRDASLHLARLVLRDPVAWVASMDARLSCLDPSVTLMFTRLDIWLICSGRRLAR
jgi:hypothetical protein